MQGHCPPVASKSSRFRGVYKRQRGGRWEASIVLESKNCRRASLGGNMHASFCRGGLLCLICRILSGKPANSYFSQPPKRLNAGRQIQTVNMRSVKALAVVCSNVRSNRIYRQYRFDCQAGAAPHGGGGGAGVRPRGHPQVGPRGGLLQNQLPPGAVRPAADRRH